MAALAIGSAEIKKVSPLVSNIWAILYDSKRKLYWTRSVSGRGPAWDPFGKPALIKTFTDKSISLKVSAYPESIDSAKEITQELKLLPLLPQEITKAMHWLGIEHFPLEFEMVILANGYSVFHETNKRALVPPIILQFFVSVTEKQVRHFGKLIEPHFIDTLPHELFHLLVHLQDYPLKNELRNETYAHLFGKCVAYPLVEDVITVPVDLSLGKEAFLDPRKDLKKIRKKLRSARVNGKLKAPKSMKAEVISRYYFQAVANNRTGKKVQSPRIPEFCEKLFTEHNFKWPIEKKPPPWFKDFLQAGREQQSTE